jgi:hypothetical protein
MRFRDRPADLRRLRPHRALFWQALAGALAFLIPISAVLYFLTIPDGPWFLVLIMQAVVIAAFLASFFSYLHVGFWVGAPGIAERGFFGLSKYVPREEIASIVLVNTFNGSATEAVPQLFICDHGDRQLLRMRGQFWSLASMELVAEKLDFPITQLGDDVSRSELLDTHPGLLYWFERHPRIVGALTTTAVLGAMFLVWGIYAMAGSS